ncbi:MAG: hypothetical protein C0498_13560 [Anaerolinea sp.]|nr:hypothetical protein [Anaerolinea sp.]
MTQGQDSTGLHGSWRRTLAPWAARALWALWLLTFLTDLLAGRGVTGFAALMFVAFLTGQVLTWRHILPNPLPPRWAVATLVLCAAVALVVAIYVAVSLRLL